MMDEFLDDIGIRDLQDEFTEIGNEFREEFGLKTKMTHAERKELEELEEKAQKAGSSAVRKMRLSKTESLSRKQRLMLRKANARSIYAKCCDFQNVCQRTDGIVTAN